MHVLAQVNCVGSWVVIFVEMGPFFAHMIVIIEQRLNPPDVGYL